ncbi:hypothetical protein [Amycolatopsis sp. 195334CR]|uniref:hypothetical protein n=1 Tax=Amycolatopsis sp. 195334CR TaxID=2814588 RepID=UPI001A8F3DA0|nr:hypothetical protein [Amycolatopsis sp. 195334CR]MBN6040042.1 hypothetical protein [Amycolatopsis sp. 195334CR]
MTTRWRDRLWVVLVILVVGLVVAGAGVLVAVAELENADKIASVIGAAAGVLGLVVSGASAVQARRLRPGPPRAALAEGEPDAPAASPGVRDVSMHAEATDDARIYQAGGDMTINDR